MTASTSDAGQVNAVDAGAVEQVKSNALRRARRYHESFPDTSVGMIAGHLAVVGTGVALDRAITRHLDQFGLLPARYSLLRALYFTPEKMLPQSEIAREMGTSQPNITQLLHVLERDGLVERVVLPNNRRVTFARLTAAGEAKCAVAVPSMVQFMQESMAGLSEAEMEQLYQLLARVRSTAEALYANGLPAVADRAER